jgi:hypothetical protein
MSKERSIGLLICIAIFAVFCFAGAADAASCKDRDNDGYFNNEGCGTAVDCDDNDAAINPDATEVCDGIDNNCDGSIDEGFDADGDGYSSCGGDCNDADPAVNPGASEGPEGDPTCSDTIDNDCDGLTDTAQDPGCAPFDCSMYNDRNICNDDPNCMWEGGKNNGQCVPTPTCTDNDGDGYGEGAACLGPDCDDTNPAVNPGAAEICDDTVDNDCDGLIDDPDPDCAPVDCSSFAKRKDCVANEGCMWQDGMCIPMVVCTDNDGDGYNIEGGACGAVDCNDADPAINPGASDANCNGVDENCDTIPDDGYVITPTSCGDGVCAANGQLECQGGSEVDTCTPGPQNEPTDVTCDGLDGDCDGVVDEDYVITSTSCGVGECAASGQLECQGGSEVDTCSPGTPGVEGPEGDPTCGDTLDNDCDGLTDTPEDPDCQCIPTGQADDNCDGIDDDCNGTADDAYVAPPTTCGVGECAGNTGLLECQSGSTVDTCDPLAGAAADDSVCNGLDDDCDGLTDEEYATSPTTCGVGECSGNTGQLECQGGSEVDSCDPLAGAAADDSVCNGLDDDCDGLTDEEYATSPTTCGVGECSGNTGLLECQGGSEVDTCDPLAGAAADDSVCNGLDDDCDGLTDEEYATSPTTCGVGECSGNTGQLECQGGSEVDTCDPLAGAGVEGPEGDPTCSDTLDNDCDGDTDIVDQDCACVPTGSPDDNCDGIDDDCNGTADDAYVAPPTTCGVGECSGNTGLLECQGGSTVDTCDPLAGAAADDSVCNGLDDDCDGPIDEDYTATPTTCGVGECSGNTGLLECQAGSTVDTCDPLAGAAADDSLCNGLDDDCDGPVDEDYTATPTTCGVGECSGNTGLLECQAGSTVDTCDPLAGAAADDSLCNGLDDDCDGPIDEDYTATPTTCGVGECSGNTGLLECQAGSTVDTCDPFAGAAPNDALCNGLDDDCDGPVDEDFVISPTTCGVGECLGNTGQLECQGGSVVDTCDPLAGAAPDDSVCNGLDDDCDGPIDEDYVTSTTNCGTGVCSSTGLLECITGSEVDSCTPGSPTEDPEATCDDGLDNDCDGLTDAPDDPDCPVGGQTCVECHNGIPSGGSGYVTREVVNVDYLQPSRHIFGGTVTDWDCIVCHREGDANQAAAGVVANTAVHQNAQVEMRNVDSINTGGVFDKNNTSDAMYTELDNFCMGCHDTDGASGINVKATDDGVNLNNSRALTPFNSSDGLSSTGTQGGTVWQAAYERVRVNDVFTKFDPTNPSHHAVRGSAYSSHDADWGAGAWVDITLKSGQSLVSSGLYEAATLHCTDCHEENSHGGPNGFRLRAPSIDETCYLCHNSAVYSNNSSSLTRWDHSNDAAVWGSSVWAKIGQYDGNTGSACMNCHGGDPAVDGFGGIHGLEPGTDWRSGEERFRFQGGSYMSHQPGSWTTTGGTSTCYFAGSSSQDWSNCSRHSGDDTGRTTPAQYDRGVPGTY